MAKEKYDLYLYSLPYNSYTLVKENCTERAVSKEIEKWCAQNNFKSYYTRIISREDGRELYDFGSHHIFFVLKPKEENTND